MKIEKTTIHKHKDTAHCERVRPTRAEPIDYVTWMAMTRIYIKNLNRLFSIFMMGGAFSMSTLTAANAEEHFEVKKEIVLTDSRPFNLSINSATDGGYIVTGSIGGSTATATRLDAQGQELWHYVTAKDTPPEGHTVPVSWHASQFTSAVVLKNGNTLLCGDKSTEGDEHFIARGLLTRVDAKGQLIDQRFLSPGDGKNFKLNSIYQCAQWGDNGYVAIGYASQTKPVPISGLWIMALDQQGEIKWEKLLNKTYRPSAGGHNNLLIMPNGDLVFSTYVYLPNPQDPGSHNMTDIFRIDQAGEIKQRRAITGLLLPVRQPIPASAIRFVGINLKDDGMSLLTLNDDLTDAAYLTLDKNVFGMRQALEMSDHSIVMVGSKDTSRNPYATIILYSTDLQKIQDYVLKPKRQSHWIDDAILTDVPDEMATVRSSYKSNDHKDRNILSIIKIK